MWHFIVHFCLKEPSSGIKMSNYISVAFCDLVSMKAIVLNQHAISSHIDLLNWMNILSWQNLRYWRTLNHWPLNRYNIVSLLLTKLAHGISKKHVAWQFSCHSSAPPPFLPHYSISLQQTKEINLNKKLFWHWMQPEKNISCVPTS